MGPNFIIGSARLFEKMDQVGSQPFLAAEKTSSSISEKLIETESVVSHTGSAHLAYRVPSNVWNISRAVVYRVRQFFDESIESIVIDTEDLARFELHLSNCALQLSVSHENSGFPISLGQMW